MKLIREALRGGGGGGRIYMSLIVSLSINASRRCRKLNENGNSLSLLEFYKWGVSDAL